MTILCLASYEKGQDFLREAKQQGCRVLLLTSLSLKDTAEWPSESIDEIFYMPDPEQEWDRAATLNAVSYLARTERIERIVPLDDFDLETAAALREHLRLPGLGDSATRHFRDKLAMRVRARSRGLAVPDFIHVLHHDSVNEFLARVPAPWVLKPRFMAGSMGIKKVHSPLEFWDLANRLGDRQSHFLLERFVPGDIFHADSIVNRGEVLWARASQYGRPPLEVSLGGVFTTRTCATPDEQTILAANEEVIAAMGLVRGVAHTEFIRAHEDGRIYFLETAARVGGAGVADMVAAATGINMWAEWAKVEIAGPDGEYTPPAARADHAGLIVSLARQEHPDTSSYTDPEIVWRMSKRHHVGFIVRSADYGRVTQLLAALADRTQHDFNAVLPPRDRPTS